MVSSINQTLKRLHLPNIVQMNENNTQVKLPFHSGRPRELSG